MKRRLLVIVLASVWVAGCGGKVDEEPAATTGADAGADGATGGGQGGAGGSSGCALPPGRPEYPHCYPSLGGSCLEPSETSKLVEKLPVLSGQKITGPWVARMEDACAPACCYGP